MEAFESVLSIIDGVFYDAWDTQGIPDSSDRPFFWLLPLAAGNYIRVSIESGRIPAVLGLLYLNTLRSGVDIFVL
jgi:hypothetical protein